MSHDRAKTGSSKAAQDADKASRGLQKHDSILDLSLSDDDATLQDTDKVSKQQADAQHDDPIPKEANIPEEQLDSDEKKEVEERARMWREHGEFYETNMAVMESFEKNGYVFGRTRYVYPVPKGGPWTRSVYHFASDQGEDLLFVKQRAYGPSVGWVTLGLWQTLCGATIDTAFSWKRPQTRDYHLCKICARVVSRAQGAALKELERKKMEQFETQA